MPEYSSIDIAPLQQTTEQNGLHKSHIQGLVANVTLLCKEERSRGDNGFEKLKGDGQETSFERVGNGRGKI